MARVMIGNVKGPIGPQGIQGASFKLRGTWTSGTAYSANLVQIDVVEYAGSCYGCILSHTASTTNAPPNATYWVLLASKGDRGDEGPPAELANNLITTTEGFALDATQGRILNEKILPLQTAAQDSGWIILTPANGYVEYNDSYGLIRVRKIGAIVTVQGVVCPPANTAIGGNVHEIFAYLPDAGFNPVSYVYESCRGSGTAIWQFSVTPNGELRAGRYADGTSYVKPPTTASMGFQMTYMTA